MAVDNLEKTAFLAYVDLHIREVNWSLDACVGEIMVLSFQIAGIEIWCNSLPCKILNHRTPDEVI